MKKLQFLAAALLAVSCLPVFFSCTQKVVDTDAFVIEGKLPSAKYDSACLYLVPMEGPHPRPVDSVFVNQDGSFRFEGNVEQMAVLRLDQHVRFGIQDLLVCTEPGVTRVVLDSISSCIEGTPQNMALQQWKDRIAQYSSDMRVAFAMRQAGATPEEVKQLQDSIGLSMGNDLYDMLKGLGRQTVSIFINKMRNGKIDSLRVAELNELLKDTVDWTQPQPGFHK